MGRSTWSWCRASSPTWKGRWASPRIARPFGRLASFARVIVFDKPGTGLSDPADGPTTLEERMEDLTAVLDAAGSSAPPSSASPRAA